MLRKFHARILCTAAALAVVERPLGVRNCGTPVELHARRGRTGRHANSHQPPDPHTRERPWHYPVSTFAPTRGADRGRAALVRRALPDLQAPARSQHGATATRTGR